MPTPRKPPRKSPRTKVNDQAVRAKIVAALSAGAYRETAAQHAGISVSTFYRWMEQGEADYEADKASDHREVWEAVKKAEADAETTDVALIKKAARDGSWQAAAWLLERKRPDRWGRRQRIEHSGVEGAPAVRMEGLSGMTLEERRLLLSLAEKASSAGDADG